jgi:signal transduction histidine kinase/ligand-binding sensor domain-containing protein
MLAAAVFASDAPVQYHLDAWTTDNGLPDNSIRALCQTRDGYLWLTTGDGLVRFDGVRFRVFNKANTPALTTNRFAYFALLEDRRGALWAGTQFGGVVRYHNGVFTNYTTREGLPDNNILRIDEDDQGTIWIFTGNGLAQWKDGRLVRMASDSGSFGTPRDSPANFGVDRSYFGLWRLDDGGWRRFAYGRWTRLPLPPHLTDAAKLHIDSIVEDSSRRLWFHLGTRRGEFYCIRDGRLAVFHDVGSAGDAFVVYQDRLGRLLVGNHNSRVTLWKDGLVTPLPGLSTPAVMRALEDREGQLWIGTKDEGLYRIREQIMTVYRHPGGPAFNAARVMLQDRAGSVWFGGGSGLTGFSKGSFKNYYRPTVNRPHGPNAVYGLYEDRDGTILVAMADGVARFRNGRFLEERKLSAEIKGGVNAIHRDRTGSLWLGGSHGLWRLRDDSLRHYGASDGLTGGTVRVIYEDRAGALWVGTDAGLSHLTGSGFVSFTSAGGWSPGGVRSLHEDDQGILWAGGSDGGLSRLAAGREGVKLTRYTTKDGLYSNSVYQILEDDLGFFWISCHLGIYRVSKQELNDFAAGRVSEITSTHFKADDLSNVAFSSGLGQPAGFKAPDGKLWFATLAGIVTIDPGKIVLNPASPSVAIEECSLDRQLLDSRNGLRIAPGQQNLEIHYTGLSFIQSNQIRFKYQMQGLDRDWTDAGTRRTAYYSHVPPGQYTFRVIAANSDGVWNWQGTSLSVVVLPAFYQTWWFTALGIFSAAGLMLTIYHRRVAQLHKAQAAQEAFSRQLIDSQESERKRIAAELHDSLGQNLLIIKNRAVIGSMTEPGAQSHFNEIAASATQSIEEVRQIAYNLRPHHLDRLGLTQAVDAMIEKVADSTQIHFTSELDSIDGLFRKEAEITVFRVIQESINNIVKHSQASDAKVRTERESGVVTIRIEDNGRGFAPHSPAAASRLGFGLTGISERVRILGGEHAVRSAPGQGTTILIKLPIHSPAKERRNGQ